MRNILDDLDNKDLKSCFLSVIEKEINDEYDIILATETLIELSDMQWHTYEYLNPKLKEELENWIEKNWKQDSFEYINNVITIIAYLGLNRSFELLKKTKFTSFDDEMLTEINDAIKELQDNVNEPYSGMR